MKYLLHRLLITIFIFSLSLSMKAAVDTLYVQTARILARGSGCDLNNCLEDVYDMIRLRYSGLPAHIQDAIVTEVLGVDANWALAAHRHDSGAFQGRRFSSPDKVRFLEIAVQARHCSWWHRLFFRRGDNLENILSGDYGKREWQLDNRLTSAGSIATAFCFIVSFALFCLKYKKHQQTKMDSKDASQNPHQAKQDAYWSSYMNDLIYAGYYAVVLFYYIIIPYLHNIALGRAFMPQLHSYFRFAHHLLNAQDLPPVLRSDNADQ